MKRVYRFQLVGILGGILVAFLFGPNALEGDPKVKKYRYSDIDMPVSLAMGTVRTPEFVVKPEAYFIMVEVEKPFPFHDMKCMMAIASGPTDTADCRGEPLLKADWTVWDDGQTVSQGSSTTEGYGMFTDKHVFKIIGQFMGEAKRKYVVEVKFTRDGSPLNAANPHLIVILVRYH
jgi:hypothetical protein